MPDLVLVKRPNPSVPFGFKLQGGQDFSIPLSILEITPNSVADQVGLRAGDAIIKIGNVETNWMEHNRAKQELMNAGNEFWLTVIRNAVNPNKPQLTPLSALKSNSPQNMGHYSQPPPVKTSLAVDKGQTIQIGNSHNRAPMPFNRNVGSSVVYQAAKPINWQPGDYTQLNEPTYNNNVQSTKNQYNNTPQIQYSNSNNNIFNNQRSPQQYSPSQQYNPQQNVQLNNENSPQLHKYNSPKGLYSKANLMEEIRTQTKVNTSHVSELKSNSAKIQSQPTQQINQSQYIQPQNRGNDRGATSVNEAKYQQNQINQGVMQDQSLRSAANSRASGSMSMRMLDKGLQECEGTDRGATSVFDLKRGNNPTGAAAPRGFRSVMAPVELPPEQRHAPMHKEYQVIQNRQNWIEPKML